MTKSDRDDAQPASDQDSSDERPVPPAFNPDTTLVQHVYRGAPPPSRKAFEDSGDEDR